MELSEYDKGWWDCFLSFAAQLMMCQPSAETYMETILNNADLKQDEIEAFILYSTILTDCYPNIKEYLKEYIKRKFQS